MAGINSSRFFYKTNTGYHEFNPALLETVEISDLPEPECNVVPSSDSISIVVNVKWQLKDLMHITGMTNNYIRSHGGKPIRKVPERFL